MHWLNSNINECYYNISNNSINSYYGCNNNFNNTSNPSQDFLQIQPYRPTIPIQCSSNPGIPSFTTTIFFSSSRGINNINSRKVTSGKVSKQNWRWPSRMHGRSATLMSNDHFPLLKTLVKGWLFFLSLLHALCSISLILMPYISVAKSGFQVTIP